MTIWGRQKRSKKALVEVATELNQKADTLRCSAFAPAPATCSPCQARSRPINSQAT